MSVLRFDPFRDLERLTDQFLSGTPGTASPRLMPMDLYRAGDRYVLQADLPGIDPHACSARLRTSRTRAPVSTSAGSWWNWTAGLSPSRRLAAM